MAKMPPEIVGKNKELYLAALKNTIPMYSLTGKMDPKGADAVLAVFSEGSPEVAKANIDVTKTYTNKYVEQVKKTTGDEVRKIGVTSASQAMSGTTPPVIHRVSDARPRLSQPWSWPFAEARRAEIDGAFRRQAARKARDVERPRPARAQSGVFRRPLQRQLFRNRFRKFSGLARLGLSRPGRVQRLRHGRAALRRRRLRARRDGPAHVERRAHLLSRQARPISTTSGTARSIFQAASRAKLEEETGLDARRISRASRIGTASTPGLRSR